LGVPPTRPETGYGYIEEGDQILADGVLNIRRFHEKPDADRAKTYVESGLHLWNASIFVFKAGAYLDELALLAPAVLGAATASVDTAMRDLDFVRLDAESFAAAPSISIDFAVMEKTKRAAVARLASDWSDVGSWEEMWRHSEHDEHGNARVGDVITVDTSGSYIRSDGRLVATLGLTDHVVVATKDSVMVAPRTRAQDIKLLAEKVAAAGRSEHDSHVRVYRPWGYYEGIDAAPGFQVKRIMVKPGERLSLQKHAHRSEHWIIVSGRARVTIDERIFELEANQSTYVPVGSIHRLENCEAEPLLMVEVQCGDYLGEDDIIRLEDNYHRS
ncbi:MAG: mannose-1-phosphate guanylyltransferase/mannose-6-phosphate isomerase, partial [Rhodospirillaceae bacterium]|nr:mannose-1-phosphate guanylyltransferase/mannose-6-phosphate isomerase [Rhodospirillaceae bacterium]